MGREKPLRWETGTCHRARSLRQICVPISFAFCLASLAVSLCSAEGPRGIVVSVHPEATQAGLRAFQQGGNAIDAAVATALALGVVDGHNSGIGGGCFMLLRLADGTIEALDGRETAPLRITAGHYLTNGQPDVRRSQLGALAPGVPGALAVYEHVSTKLGVLQWKNQLRAAAELAAQGFKLDANYEKVLAGNAGELSLFPAAKQIFLGPDGAPRKAGEIVKQPDLARTYRAIGEEGARWFYNGPFAKMTAAWMAQNGGVLNEEDFRRYQVKLRDPIRTTYRGFDIIGFPPPSSGGVHVAQILNILEQFKLSRMGAGTADSIHLITEAMKLAFADRAFWLGDPDFVKVPRGLTDKEYGERLSRQISPGRSGTVLRHGEPKNSGDDFFGRHTTHFCAADTAGNWVACTATLNTSFGSKVVIPGTGVVLNNQMDDFSLSPGVANYFGLVGGAANAVAPGKRPLSSMSPTIVLKNGTPVFSIGAAGGPTIISQAVLGLVGYIDFGWGPERALAAPRFHHQWQPDLLQIERRVDASVLDELRRRGHAVRTVETLGAAQAMARAETNGLFTGSPDPRGAGQALAW